MIWWRRVGEEWRWASPLGEFVISVIGENASGKPVLWELTSPDGHNRTCDSVTEAKATAEVFLALRQERARVRIALKKLQANCRCGNFDMDEILSAIAPKQWKSPSRRGKKRIVLR